MQYDVCDNFLHMAWWNIYASENSSFVWAMSFCLFGWDEKDWDMEMYAAVTESIRVYFR